MQVTVVVFKTAVTSDAKYVLSMANCICKRCDRVKNMELLTQ
jgi:hypothetical protein